MGVFTLQKLCSGKLAKKLCVSQGKKKGVVDDDDDLNATLKNRFKFERSWCHESVPHYNSVPV